MSRVARRTLLSAAMAGVAAPALAGCRVQSDPGPMSAPTLRQPPPDCVELASHDFELSGVHCEANLGARGGGDGDGVIVPILFYGQPMATTEHVTAIYVDAVVEWEIATGEPTRLLAPRRSDNDSYASRGELTIVPRCDGALIVHRDGCVVNELVGHEPGGQPVDGIQGLCLVDDQHLLSLGTDKTLRRWNVEEATEEVSVRLAGRVADRTISHVAAINQAVVSNQTSAQIFDATSLEQLGETADLPVSEVGWRGLPNGDLVGVSADDAQRGVHIWHHDSAEVERWQTKWDISHFAISDEGAIGIVDDGMIQVRELDGGLHTVEVDSKIWEATGRLAFSPDAKLLHSVSPLREFMTFDVATGAHVMTYRHPGTL